jgi:hypothetical protein
MARSGDQARQLLAALAYSDQPPLPDGDHPVVAFHFNSAATLTSSNGQEMVRALVKTGFYQTFRWCLAN